VEAGTGQGNQNEPTLYFGLGKETGPLTMEIAWPGGKTQTIQDVSIDRLLVVDRQKTRD
jgi:hypothetical protein